jgi:hypothetical protein
MHYKNHVIEVTIIPMGAGSYDGNARIVDETGTFRLYIPLAATDCKSGSEAREQAQALARLVIDGKLEAREMFSQTQLSAQAVYPSTACQQSYLH